jgi:hypothetical protein
VDGVSGGGEIDFDPWLTAPAEDTPCSKTAVDIIIKPDGGASSINCNNPKTIIAVAILTTNDFDATTVDDTTVTFEGASEIHVNKKTGDPKRHEKDIDGDGDIDLVFHFRLGDTDLTCDSTEGTLTGFTFDGEPIVGTGEVTLFAPHAAQLGSVESFAGGCSLIR